MSKPMVMAMENGETTMTTFSDNCDNEWTTSNGEEAMVEISSASSTKDIFTRKTNLTSAPFAALTQEPSPSPLSESPSPSSPALCPPSCSYSYSWESRSPSLPSWSSCSLHHFAVDAKLNAICQNLIQMQKQGFAASSEGSVDSTPLSNLTFGVADPEFVDPSTPFNL
ncbi:hypothetical protein Fmac_020718 [Flemingia macrophylla]|uniref:Uncharacterized protein n=1 Tax=Flemingia macrophylla TaxID=520843 RepID=A0ABD1LV08_9FABA